MKTPPPRDIGLAPMDSPGLEHLRRWLGHPNVSRWWGDPDESLAAVTQHPSDDQALITVAGRPVGYLLWQRLDHASMAAAGLDALPADHVDVDILIGEPELMGQGIGPAALHLILGRLGAEGVSSVGVMMRLPSSTVMTRNQLTFLWMFSMSRISSIT